MKQLAILLLLFSICSCMSSAPKDILPPDKMQAVLWDVMQADEVADYYSPSDSSFKTLSKHEEYYRKVFALHNTTKDAFNQSLKYYQDHPSTLKPLLDSLQRHQQMLQEHDSSSQKQTKPILVDSARRKHLIRTRPL